MDSPTDDVVKTIVCQIGAREHYQTACELYDKENLSQLFTDYWAFHKLPVQAFSNLNNRHNPEIPSNRVTAFNLSYLAFELNSRRKRLRHWPLHMARNAWFQKRVVNHLSENQKQFNQVTEIFAYSYAAKEIFKYARTQGWKMTLGQIDPGPLEEEIVMEEVQRYPQYKSEWKPAPEVYWENWKEECELADEIQVNSEWSKSALINKGIAENKIKIYPLTYKPPKEATIFQRQYPEKFSKERPLRVLFLGQIIMRKGIARVIEVAKLMIEEPIEFYLVGPEGISPIPDIPNIKLTGRVPRNEVQSYYKKCDVFLFPTLSDGYGLTQLEAMTWKMPVLVTPYAGEAINHKVNGIIMQDASINTIQYWLNQCIHDPKMFEALLNNLNERNKEPLVGNNARP